MKQLTRWLPKYRCIETQWGEMLCTDWVDAECDRINESGGYAAVRRDGPGGAVAIFGEYEEVLE